MTEEENIILSTYIDTKKGQKRRVLMKEILNIFDSSNSSRVKISP
jgi:hypothetical protein